MDIKDIVLPNGSSADIVEGKSCPWKQVGTLVESPGGKAAVIAGQQPCLRSCGIFDIQTGMCSLLSIARALARFAPKVEE